MVIFIYFSHFNIKLIKQKEKINKKGINENKNIQIETPKKY
jgi:hypothetical protein